jgi:hypothetical protein
MKTAEMIEQGQADPQKMYWFLDQAVGAFNRRDWKAGDGWFARLRIELAIGFPPRGEVEAAMVNVGELADGADLDQMLENAIEAKWNGQPALAAGWLARLHPVPGPVFDYCGEVVEAMELAGFGEVVLVDTGVGLPE